MKTPATPLQWTLAEHKPLNSAWHYASLYAGERLVARLDLTNGPSGSDGQANAAYIAHAANAYPQLVAAIQEDLKGYLGDFPAGHAATKLRDLLRALGEQS